MPHSYRNRQQLAKGQDSRDSPINSGQLEERYQLLVQQFRQVQLQVHAVQTQYRTVRKEALWLHQVVNIKQGVIEQLLPYYPEPLTPELLYAIELY